MDSNDPYLASYLKEVSRYKQLSFDEMVELAKRRDQGDVGAREKMIVSNLALVVWTSKRYQRWSPLEDLIAAGNEGLIIAVDKWDHTRNLEFATYAVWWIRQRIREMCLTLASQVKVPSSVRTKINKLEEKQRHEKGRFSKKDLKRLRQLNFDARRAQSVGSIITVSESGDEIEAVPTGRYVSKNPSFILEIREALVEVEDRLESIFSFVQSTCGEKRVVAFSQYYQIGGSPSVTLMDLSKQLGVTRERIRQMCNEVISRLRKKGLIESKEDFLDLLAKRDELKHLEDGYSRDIY